ncbi:MAG: WS/DGAT/MGAT family O-acyltransferase [Acidimicrobiales bacterium]
MQRLSGLDAMFLYLETPSSHMHVTGVYVLEPGERGLSFDAVRDLVASRLPLALQFRRRLVEMPFKLHHPIWVEDAGFDLDYHVRRAALPSPGGPKELAAYAAHVGALPLDRTRPLWELYVVEGLKGGRVALVGKMHHAAVDGVSGAEIMATLLDLEPDPPARLIVDSWRPEESPTEADLVALAMASLVGHPVRAARTARDVVETALQLSEHNRESGVSPPPALFGAPKTTLNVAITPHRRVAFAARPLDDFKAVKNHFSCTVNDVVLAVCAGALRRYLLDRGDLPAEPLVAMVPMSVRTDDDAGMSGNRVSAMLTSLATDLGDAVERLETVVECMGRAKAQERLIGAATLTDWTEFAFPALISRAARLTASMRVFDHLRPLFNVTVSNVPGPPFPLFLAGARMVGMYPLGPVTEGIGLNITVMSYCGMVYFGLNACRETVPDLDEFPQLLQESLDELLRAAGRGARRKPRDAGDAAAPDVPDGTAPAVAAPGLAATDLAATGLAATDLPAQGAAAQGSAQAVAGPGPGETGVAVETGSAGG